ncbi:hypothetical protein SAMN05444358_11543 [Ruegeria halocynthiae]|uniref:Uncharacterized protein n=1 Tax=Ruegeria halocynthiae TaxID=985054 RepID=A0A1H3FIN2_9RHOB|nr:hypothetical protein [Ruegeria halocynthiae]SDX90922.1 hypothetical protein SAMN05444358_11543 [Ruegeria halocynthiae]
MKLQAAGTIAANSKEEAPQPKKAPFEVLGLGVGDNVNTLRASLQIGQTIVRASRIDAKDGAILHLSFDALTRAREALQAATADTKMSLTLVFTNSDEAEAITSETHLETANMVQMILPVMLDPGARRVVGTRMDTLVFGDPSYDRQLAGETLPDLK